MSAYKRRLSYRYITCPHCGNEIAAKSVNYEQKCEFCRRKYKIVFSTYGTKVFWEPVAIDYSYDSYGGNIGRKGALNERKHQSENS